METCTHFWNLFTGPQYQPIILLRPHKLFNAFNYMTTMHCITLFTNRPKLFSLTQLPKIASSDHYSILAKPILGGETKLISKSKIRDMRDSAWCALGRWITQKDWSSVLEANMCKDKFDLFNSDLLIDSFHKKRLKSIQQIDHGSLLR